MIGLTLLEIVLIIIAFGIVLAIIMAAIDAHHLEKEAQQVVPKKPSSPKSKPVEAPNKKSSVASEEPKQKMVESLSGPVKKTMDGFVVSKPTPVQSASETSDPAKSDSVAEPVAQEFQYWAFRPTLLRGKGSENAVQISSFHVYQDSQWIPAETVTNPNGENPEGEGPAKANQESLEDKWLDLNKGSLVYDLGAPYSITYYNWATANDDEERDPIRWVVEASSDGEHWVVIDDRSQIDQKVPRERKMWVAPGNDPLQWFAVILTR